MTKRALLEKALRIKEREYGLEQREVAKTLTSLGNAYGYLGDAQVMRDLLKGQCASKDVCMDLDIGSWPMWLVAALSILAVFVVVTWAELGEVEIYWKRHCASKNVCMGLNIGSWQRF